MTRIGALLLAALLFVPAHVMAQPGDNKKETVHTRQPVDLPTFVTDRSANLLQTFDVNGDGLIDEKEIAAKFEADFKRLDADGDGLFDPQLDRQAISHQQKPVSKIPTSSLTLHEIGGAIGSTVRDAVQSRGNTQRGHHLWTSLTPEQKQATIGRFNIEMSKRPSAL